MTYFLSLCKAVWQWKPGCPQTCSQWPLQEDLRREGALGRLKIPLPPHSLLGRSREQELLLFGRVSHRLLRLPAGVLKLHFVQEDLGLL